MKGNNMFGPDEIPTYIVDLPHNVPGLSCLDEEGTPMIYLNAKHSSEKNRSAYEHELTHIRRDDFHNNMPIELVEAITTPASATAEATASVSIVTPAANTGKQVKKTGPTHLFLSENMQQEAHRLFGISPDDRRWPAIIFAMLLTGSHEIIPTRRCTRTYFFHPVKVWKGAIYQMRGKAALKPEEQMRFLHPYNYYS